MPRLLALILTLLALTVAAPAGARPIGDAGGDAGGVVSDADAISGLHIRELKDELIAERLSCDGATGASAGSEALAVGLLLGLLAWSTQHGSGDRG